MIPREVIDLQFQANFMATENAHNSYEADKAKYTEMHRQIVGIFRVLEENYATVQVELRQEIKRAVKDGLMRLRTKELQLIGTFEDPASVAERYRGIDI